MQLFKKRAYTLYYPEECFNCTPHNVTIGDQIWTGCNLSVTTYRNGDTIPQVTDPTVWETLTTGAWCHVNGDPANEPTYGRLYNWYAVTDPRGLGPVGYHIPTVTERDTLASYLGGLSVAGGKLKEVGTCHWSSPNVGATNESGFTAFGAGDRSYDGTYENFNSGGAWWTSTPAGFNPLFASNFNVAASIPNFMGPSTFSEKVRGYSVRLIQDEIIPPTGCSTYSVPPGYANDPNDGYLGYNTVEYLDCDSNPQTIVVASNESAQDICATEIVSFTIEPTLTSDGICTIVPWDSLTANREQGFISLSGTTNGTTACEYPAPDVDVIYVATHVPYTLSVGDRVFLSDLPSITPFNGSTGIPPYNPMYWKISLLTEFSPCTGSGTRALIDKDGFITELYCCP